MQEAIITKAAPKKRGFFNARTPVFTVFIINFIP